MVTLLAVVWKYCVGVDGGVVGGGAVGSSGDGGDSVGDGGGGVGVSHAPLNLRDASVYISRLRPCRK